MSATGISQSGMENQIPIIPNPAKDEFLLLAPFTGLSDCKLEIYRIDGQFMRSLPVTASETKVDISSLTAGVYLLKIEMDGLQFTKRLVKY